MQAAASDLEDLITTPVTLNIRVGYGEAGGSPLANGMLGEEVTTAGTLVTAAQYEADLQAHGASDAAVQTALANMPSDSTPLFITSAQEKALGLLAPNAATIDGSVGFAADPNQSLFAYSSTDRAVGGKYDFIGVAEHEITHALGRVAINGYSAALDLFRYAAPGEHAPAGAPSYFSIDGGVTNLDDFAAVGDVADWATSAGPDANDAFAATGNQNPLSQTDVTELKVLGFSVTGPELPPSAGTSNTPAVPDVGASTALVSSGLNAASLAFLRPPKTVTLSGATSLALGLDASPGVTEVSGFRYGLDHLTLDLRGMRGTLQAFDTSVGGSPAIALAGMGNLFQGVVLTGLGPGMTAQDLMANHLTVSGRDATIA